jgi:hypothetical protein
MTCTGSGKRQRLVQVRRRPPVAELVQQRLDQLGDVRPQDVHATGRKRRGQQPAHHDMVSGLSGGVARGTAENRGLGDPRGTLGLRVRAAEPGVGQQRLDLRVARDQPRHITRRGAHRSDRRARLQSPVQRRNIQHPRSRERQLGQLVVRHDHPSHPAAPDLMDALSTLLAVEERARRSKSSRYCLRSRPPP